MKSEPQKYLSLAIKLILILSIINAIQNHFWHIMSTNFFLLILMFAPQIIKKYEIKIPLELEWLLLIFVIFTLFLGKFSGIIAPIFFGIAVALIGFMILAILYSSNQIKKNYFLIIMFSFNFAVAFGFALEFIKFYLKKALGQAIDGGIYSYSMQNMTFVILGAGISAIFGYIYMKTKSGILGKILDKFKKSNPKIFGKMESKEELIELIQKGEDEKTEFKETLRVNTHTGEIDKKIENSALKTLTSFMNSQGGTLLIGISDSKEIIGIEKDRFENTDKFNLHLISLIKEKIGKKHLHLIDFETIKINEKKITKINVQKSKKPVFFKPNPQEEEFYIRAGPSSNQLKGSELVDYISKRFGKD